MPKHLPLRFSLLSLLLLTTLVAVGLSHLLTSRQLLLSQLEIDDQREKIRELSHSLGLLTVEDRLDAHVWWINDEAEDKSIPGAYRQFEFRWLIHLPSQKRWRILWSTQRIPTTGLPQEATGSFEFVPSHDDWSSLELRFEAAGKTEWTASIHSEYDHAWHTCDITWDQGHWLEPGAQTQQDIAVGFPSCRARFVTCPSDEPLIIFRELQLSRGQPNGGGFILWAEPIGDAVP
jgi:hypothetical protein